jgi:hypothetical protein
MFYFVVPPSVTFYPKKSQIINEGDTLILKCGATGDPLPNITWTMSNSTSVISYEPLLTIRNISRFDEGTYVCMASNGVGENDTAIARIYVNCK